jgi:hypothetical protein
VVDHLNLIIAFLVLAIIFYEDLRHRAVHWFWFPVLFGTFFLYSVQWLPWKEWLVVLGINLVFLLLQLGLITLYFSLRNKRLEVITQGFLGWGDVLFMVCACACFNLANYMVFHVFSLVFALLSALFIPRLKQKGIPLAGLQAFLLLAFLLLSKSLKINPFDDNWLFWGI